MTLSMIFPITRQLVVFQFRRRGPSLSTINPTTFFSATHIISAGPRKALPNLLKLFGMT